MFTDFQQRYANLSDDELLHLASQRASLTDEAKTALDIEMGSRKLISEDVRAHSRSVGRAERREAGTTSRRIFLGVRFPQAKSWTEILTLLFSTAVVMLFIWAAYSILPTRYRLRADWQETATYVMFSSVVLIVWLFREWGRTSIFWMSLLISATTQALIVHTWISHVGTDVLWRNNAGKGATSLGLLLFALVYACTVNLRRKLNGEQTSSGGIERA